MQTLKSFMARKLDDAAFKTLFEKECHVCGITMAVCGKLQVPEEKEKALAALGILPEAVQELEDADYCDPFLVVRLCRHFNIAPPENCPRMST